ncbi:MAG: flippase-like domain-containing protein [Desulfobacteraceae bacterium]|nr:flippase-like domain-containing protein [Desulfobacteraceae bacterium]
MKLKIAASLIIGVIVSLATLMLAFRNVPVRDLLDYVQSINYIWIVPATAAILISYAFKAVRWQLILGTTARIGFWQSFHPIMIGFMINCVLPLRAGELARPAILKKKENIPFSLGLATVAAERFFDIALLLTLFIVVLSTIPLDAQAKIDFAGYRLNAGDLQMVAGTMAKLSVVLFAGIIFISFNATRSWLQAVLIKIPSAGAIFNKAMERPLIRICTWMNSLIENFAAGFQMLKSPKRVAACAGLSVLVWGFAALSYYIFSMGCPGINLSFWAMTAVMIIICFFITLPSAPGFWGLWEAGGVFALSLFGVVAKDAAGFTLANHAIQLFPVILLGIVSAMITSVNIIRISYEREVP